MSRPSDPQAVALLDHVFAQTLSNIEFLASHNYISAVDASQLSSRLISAQGQRDPVGGSLAASMQALAVAPAPPPSRRNVPSPPQPRTVQARALWAYNEDGRVRPQIASTLSRRASFFFIQEPNDLSFSAGEIVEIVDETNADWWTGKCRGRQGLFPSNHVEKLGASSPPAPSRAPQAASPVYSSPPGPPQAMIPTQPVAPTPQYGQGYGQDPKPVYRPFGAVYQGADQPPPPGGGQVNSVGLQQQGPPVQQGEAPKKNRFGGRLGETVNCYVNYKPLALLTCVPDGYFGCRWCRLWCR